MMKRLLAFSCMALLMLGCAKTFDASKEVVEPIQKQQDFTISGTISQDDDSKVAWTESNDKLPIWEVNDYVVGWYKEEGTSSYKPVCIQVKSVRKTGQAIFKVISGFPDDIDGVEFSFIYDSEIGSNYSTIMETDEFKAGKYTMDMTDQGSAQTPRSIFYTATKAIGSGNKLDLKFDYGMAVCALNRSDKTATFENVESVENITGVEGLVFRGTYNMANGKLTPDMFAIQAKLNIPSYSSSTKYYISTFPCPKTATRQIALRVNQDGNETDYTYKLALLTSTLNEGAEFVAKKMYNLTKFTVSDHNRGAINGHEYVEIKAKYDGSTETTLKWATENIGAKKISECEKSTDYYGSLFSWGDVNGEIEGSWSDRFEQDNYNSGLRAYDADHKGSSLGGDIDDSAGRKRMYYDAARYNWNSSWRMPSVKEYQGILLLPNNTVESFAGISSMKYVLCITDVSTNEIILFFPPAGYSYDSNKRNQHAGSRGHYWTTDYVDINSSSEFYFYRNPGRISSERRYYGLSIRAVSK